MQTAFQAPSLLLRPWVLTLPQALATGHVLQEGFHETQQTVQRNWPPDGYAGSPGVVLPGQAVSLLLPWAGMQGVDDQGIPVWFSFYTTSLGFSLIQHLCAATSWPK